MVTPSGLHLLLHERLADLLRGELGRSRPGTRIDSVKVLAGRYRVSITTVRGALQRLQREGVVEVRHGAGCFVARPPSPPTRHIAILVELDLLRPCSSPFFLGVTRHLRRLFAEKRQSSRLYIGNAIAPAEAAAVTCSDFLEDLEQDRFSGVVAVSVLPNWSWAHPLKQRGVPIVGMGGPLGAFDAFVRLDLDGMTRLGAQTLIGQGCQRLAMVGWNPDAPDVFRNAIEGNGLVHRPEWTQMLFHPLEMGAGWAEWREIWIASKEKPDGLLIADDVLLPDVALAIRELGIRVPQDLRVVVATNRGAPQLRFFPMTRIECDPAEFAGKMAGQLLALMAGEEPADRSPSVGYMLECAPFLPGVSTEPELAQARRQVGTTRSARLDLEPMVSGRWRRRS